MWRVVRGRRFWAVLAVLVLASTAVRLTATAESPVLAPVSGLLQEVLAPVQGVVFRAAASVRHAAGSVAELERLRREKARLEKQVQRLGLLESQAEELRQENRRLKALLDFKEKEAGPASGRLIAARVAGRNPDDWFNYLIIDKGSADGVSRNMVALTPSGVVGRVTRVTRDSATVLLLTDPQSGVGAMVQRETSRQAGVILGQQSRGDRLYMKFFKPKADVKQGDRVVTSGLGRMYPGGLPIGEVTAVADGEDGLVRYAWIRPSVDFDRLEEVLLLPGGAGAVPPAPAD